jgi:nucleoside-diphosphate-sugar epimerase
VLDKLRRDGLDVTILRPGAICRTHNSHWGDKLIDRLQQAGWPRSRHPLDVIPWVHADDLAEMVYLCATNEATSGETYLAVDASVSLAEYWVPICQALSRPVLTPDRVPIQSRCRIGKIRRTLRKRRAGCRRGYRPAVNPPACALVARYGCGESADANALASVSPSGCDSPCTDIVEMWMNLGMAAGIR